MAMSARMWKREQERRRRERQRRARRRRNCALVVFAAVAAVAVIAVNRACSVKNSTSAPAAGQTDTTAAPQQTDSAGGTYKTDVDISKVNISFFNNAAFMGNAVADSISMYSLLPDTDFYTGIDLDVENVYTTAAGYSTTAAVDQLKSKKFNKIFLSFGEREISGELEKSFISAYMELVEKIKSYQPSAQIYIIGIPPVTREASKNEEYGLSEKKIKDYNKKIKLMAAEEDVYYVDSVKAVGSDGGYLPEGVSADGINLNRDCCIELIEYMTKKSAVPDEANIDDEDDETGDDTDKNSGRDETDDEDDEDASATASPSGKEKQPEPTVDVRKDSVKDKPGER